ncbi:glycolate oxidase subunit GlcF [Orrella daihaiensis]|uniref:Glycolate oxidase iron-sulfur subunit n=1 Tax=Orrella daihaiensis TaxID=2782176 RepID=A0ABY4AGA1_9BURK|nr:glycolate oxidase subunit GlcF [Orrella daihaiensis]UOD49209.1 glycolate oxidase subunit GlcF [Orrella daihaiensis]
MQTKLLPDIKETPLGQEAEEILRRCVHCGFCTATCPTYQVLGDELDSPRGRIYLIKEMLEGAAVTESTQLHLDRCLTCRNCETTCPSGVEYGKLIDIGRQIVDERVPRSTPEKIKRESLRRTLNASWFGHAYKLGQSVRQWLPESIKRKVIARQSAGVIPENRGHVRQVIMLKGCVQPSMMPNIDAATIRILDKLGIGAQIVQESGCCGALNFHLDAQEAGRAQMRANIDAWWPLLANGEVEAIVMNASGCGGMVREYEHHLRLDPVYAEKAKLISEHVKDIAEYLAPQAQRLKELIEVSRLPAKPVFHPPCTLQHWQGLRPQSETLLRDIGLDLQPFAETHLCCGSAGAYSVLQPQISTQLRDRKLEHIDAANPDVIVSSNIGCIGHLQSGTDMPVKHWVEVIDAALR